MLPESLLKISSALGVSADYLLTGDITDKDLLILSNKLRRLTPSQVRTIEAIIDECATLLFLIASKNIPDAHRKGISFIIIIDEEHSNNTAKARTIIDAFLSKNIVRVSATAEKNKRYEFFEIDELDVIDAGQGCSKGGSFEHPCGKPCLQT